jgi:GMP synthase (glutamine-hydrolysing)
MTKHIILILDFGSPYTQLIAQRIRENHVFSRIVPYNIPAKEIKLQKPKGIILSGRSISVSDKKRLLPDRNIFKLNIPILGIDYGMQVVIQHFGGRVKTTKLPEFQKCELFIDDTRNLFWQMSSNITCWMNYAEYIRKLPRGFKKIAHTQDNPIAAIECFGKKIFGVGFHPEVVGTQRGSQILSNFIYKICGCIGNWTMHSYIRETISGIKKTVGKGKVILNLKPTLNSAVAALLINKAIKKRLKCIFIDNGLFCKDEAKQIKKVLVSHFRLNLRYIDRSQRLIHSLKDIDKVEEKKKIVSELSIRIFQEEAKKIKGIGFLALGTVYPEGERTTLELGSLRLKPIEPLRELFEDEVKVVAKEIGLPDNMIFKQPFPETGLALRIIGEVNAPRLKILRDAQDCLVEEIKTAGIYEQIWQSFVVLLPVENIIVIRCIASVDGTTTDWVRLPYDVLDRISRRILNKVKGIERVAYDIST